MSDIKIELTEADGTVKTVIISGDTNIDTANRLIDFAEAHKIKTCAEAGIPQEVKVITRKGIVELDEEKLKARFAYIGVGDAGCIVFRLICMSYSRNEIVEMSDTQTRGAVDSQFYLLKLLIGKFKVLKLIDMFTCSIEDYNFKYYKLIEDFKINNDCTYCKQKPLQ